jgi:hypothetical protein
MKKVLAILLSVAFLATMVLTDDASAQERRRRKKYRGLATNAAIVGGSTAAGAILGRGQNGALIGTGAGLLYASSRKGSKRTARNSKFRRGAKVAGGTLLGAGVGKAAGGKLGAAIGAAAGAGSTYVYSKKRRRY